MIDNFPWIRTFVLLLSACDAGTRSTEPDTSFMAGAAGTSGSVSSGGTSDSGSAHAGQPARSGAPAAEGGASAGSGSYTLLLRDDFDALDPVRWQIMTHSWDTNLALFSQESVRVADGLLTLTLLNAPAGTADDAGTTKPFFGAEVRSRDTLTYGKVRARAKLASGSAVVSSLVTIYTPWPADNWNELDIECLGKSPAQVQFNTMVYTGPPQTPPVTTSVTPTQSPHLEALDFDAGADFHIYTLEWTPAGAHFFVDDVLRHTWTEHIELMTLPQNVLLTIWASSAASWAGAVTDQTVGAFAAYDWIELYRYSAP